MSDKHAYTAQVIWQRGADERFEDLHAPAREPAGRDAERDAEREQPDPDHDWDEDRGNPVGQCLDRGSRSLRFLHHPDDPRQHRVRAYPGRPEHEGPGPVDRAARHLVSDGLRHRHRFAGQHGLIYC